MQTYTFCSGYLEAKMKTKVMKIDIQHTEANPTFDLAASMFLFKSLYLCNLEDKDSS